MSIDPSGAYPPASHVMRDLRVSIARRDGRARAFMEFQPGLRGSDGGLCAGALATLVDIIGGESAIRAVQPDWTATSNLRLHLSRPIVQGVRAEATVLRKTRTTVVIETVLHEGALDESGASDPADAAAPVGHAIMTFSVLPARSDFQRGALAADAPLTHFALPGSGVHSPLADVLGIAPLADGRGIELPLSAYVGNSLGALQGGVVAMAVDFAAREVGAGVLGAPVTTRDLAINYLALGRRGPVQALAAPIRTTAEAVLMRIELRDRGADDRLLTVANAEVFRSPR